MTVVSLANKDMNLTINAMPGHAKHVTLNRLAKLDTAAAGHTVETGFLDPSIRPVISDAHIAGVAVTLAIPGRSSTLLHYLLDHVRAGDVIVIDRSGDDEFACVGGGVAVAAQIAGVAGIVVDGPCTDPSQIRVFGLPVWCRGVTARTTHVADAEGSINTPISCGGVLVNPGDLVVADENGILVIPPEKADEVILAASRVTREEPEALKLLRAGDTLGHLSGASKIVEEALSAEKKT